MYICLLQQTKKNILNILVWKLKWDEKTHKLFYLVKCIPSNFLAKIPKYFYCLIVILYIVNMLNIKIKIKSQPEL